MEPPRIRHCPTLIAQLLQVMAETVKGVATVRGRERKGGNRLYIRGAVQLAQVDHQPLRGVHLQGLGHVWAARQLPGKKYHQVGSHRLSAGLGEQRGHRGAVFTGVLHRGGSHSP